MKNTSLKTIGGVHTGDLVNKKIERNNKIKIVNEA